MPQSSDVLRSYRELLRLIQRLPTEKIPAALQEARSALKSNKSETNALLASDMHKELVGRIGFLKMTTPRRPGDRHSKAGRFVLRNGQLVEGEAVSKSRVADGKISMEEAHHKHNQLLRRQYFGKTPPRIREPF